jgi:hypothetical protein
MTKTGGDLSRLIRRLIPGSLSASLVTIGTLPWVRLLNVCSALNGHPSTLVAGPPSKFLP